MVQMLMTPLFFHGFFTALSEQLDCTLVIGGDLNFGLNKEMDRLSTAGTQRNWESTNIVKQYMSDYGLCDAWRSLHTNSREFTFFSHVHHSYSRLDYSPSQQLTAEWHFRHRDTPYSCQRSCCCFFNSSKLRRPLHQVITGDSIHHCLKTTILLIF